MVWTCCVCKQDQSITTDRSFHSFPSSNERKQSWLLAIGKKEVAKTARICSDHFQDEDFTTSTTSDCLRRRLHSAAVPSQNLSVIENTQSSLVEESNENKLQCVFKQEQIPVQMTASCNIVRKTENYEDTIPSKKYKISMNNNIEWICEEDFVNKKKWVVFRHMVDSLRNKIIKEEKEKCWHQKKTKDLLSTLRMEYSLSENDKDFLNGQIQNELSENNNPRSVRSPEHDDSNEETNVETIILVPKIEPEEYNLPEGSKEEPPDDDLDYGLPTDVKISISDHSFNI